MSNRHDHAPVGYTCGTIDSAIENINGVITYFKEFDDEVVQDCDTDLISAIEMIEEVRSANDELRTWGNELYEEKTELEEQVSNLENEKYELEVELEQLRDQLTGN